MLDDVQKAILVMGLMPDGSVRFFQNKRGSRLREDGLATLVSHLSDEDRAELFHLLNAHTKKLLQVGTHFTRNDACPEPRRG